MEAIEDINKALLQLKESLANMDSARNQVAQVTAGSKDVVTATAKLSDDVKALAEKISNETQSVIALFAKQLKESQSGLNGIIKEGKDVFVSEVAKSQQSTTQLKAETEKLLKDVTTVSKSTMENVNTVSKQTIESLVSVSKNSVENMVSTSKQSVHEINTTSKDTLQQSLAATTKILNEVNSITQKTIQDLASASTDSIKELTSVSTDAIEVQQTEISDALDSISDYCGRIQILIDTLSKLDLSSQLISVEKKIDSLERQQDAQGEDIRNDIDKIKRNQLITWAILIIIAIITIIVFK